MDVQSTIIDRETTTPFYLKLFYKSNAFHRPDEFTPTSEPQDHVAVYTWQSCTLRELSQLLLTALPSLLPQPCIGTRISYRLTFPDTRNTSAALPGRFMTKDLGSIVIGQGGPGVEDVLEGPLEGDSEKTLQDARFVIGDFVCCAILPPLDGGGVAPPIVGGSGGGRGGYGFTGGRGGGDFGRLQRGDMGGGGGFRGGGRGGRGGFGQQSVPMGEWRRGERLPEGPAGGRGRGGYGGRGRGGW